MSEELDLEDIESRLYSQFYHGSEQELNADSNINKNCLQAPTMFYNVKYNNRYFHKIQPLNRQTYISAADDIYTSIQNNSKSVEVTQPENLGNHFHNNITVNRYTVPIIINPKLNAIINPTLNKESVSPWPNNYGKLSVKKKRKRQTRLKKRQEENMEKRREYNLNSVFIEVDLSNQKTKVSDKLMEIITISDESDDEPVFIQDSQDALEKCVTSKTISVKHSQDSNEVSSHLDSDSDIIFIPPPLIEVINLEDDIELEKKYVKETIESDLQNLSTSLYKMPNLSRSPTKPQNKVIGYPVNFKELPNTSELNICNDFLDNSIIDKTKNKFNFSLHGSDFNNAQGDTIRQTISKVDFCETESSCSTNDLNRDATSSLKTVVFDEFEFPKEDIFSEKNLESFGIYITPKRSVSKRSETNSPMDFDISVENILNDDSSSNSSSESDYDPIEFVNKSKKIDSFEYNKKLPDLSPLQCNKKNTKNLSTKKTASQFFKICSECSDGENEISKRSFVKRDCNDEIDKDKLIRKKLLLNKKATLGNIYEDLLKKDLNFQKRKQVNVSEQGITQHIGLNCSEKVYKKKLESNNSGNEISTKTNFLHKVQRKKKIKSSTRRISKDNNGDRNIVFTGIYKPKDAEEVKQSIIKMKENFSEPHNVESNAANNLIISQKSKVHFPGSNIFQIKTSNITLVSDLVSDTTLKKQTSDEQYTVKEVSLNKLKKLSCGISENIRKQQIIKKNIDKAKAKKGCYELNKNKNFILNSSIPVLHSSDKSKVISETLEYVQLPCLQEEYYINQSEKTNVLAGDEHLLRNEQQNLVEENLTNRAVKHNYIDDKAKNEELIDEAGPNLSNLEIIDEVDSDVGHIEISSDSESLKRNSLNLENSMELANCTLNTISICNLNELISKVDRSGNTSGRIEDNEIDKISRNVDVDAIYQSQSDDPEIWKILPEDRMLHLNIDRYKRPRCNKCRQLGHIAMKCTEKIGPPNCILCGLTGHQEPRCPNKICTQCGNKGDYSTTYCWKCFKFRNSICHVCNMRGHIAKTCPDLWRRYHVTTEEGPIVSLEGPQLKPRKEQWCSGCANQGHLEHECDYYNREYPPANPCIMSYEDVLYPTGTQNHIREGRILQEDNSSPNPLPSCVASQLDGLSQSISSTSQNIPAPNNIPFNCASSVTSASMSAPSILDTSVTTLSRNDIFLVGVPSVLGSTKKTKVFNPFSVFVDHNKRFSLNHPILHQMRLNYLNLGHYVECNRFYENHESIVMNTQNNTQGNQMFKNSKRRIKHLIMSMPYRIVKQFLKKELAELEDLLMDGNPRYLKKKLFKYDRLSQYKKSLNDNILIEKSFWNRIFNMFIFGIHKFGDAKSHMNYLKKCLSNSERNMDKHHRKLLLNSYYYIFGVDRHVNVNYYKILQQLIQIYDEGTFDANM